MAVASPCTNVCAIDPKTGLCLGCARSLDEIAEWDGERSPQDDDRRLGQVAARMIGTDSTEARKRV